MKKLLFALPVLLCLGFNLYAYNGYYAREKKSRRNQQNWRYSEKTNCQNVSCIECCRNGHWANCPSYCNKCQQYNDAAASEYRDYP